MRPYGLAEECRETAGSTQILVTTHSPFFLDALRPGEVRVLWRDEWGYTQCHALDQNHGSWHSSTPALNWAISGWRDTSRSETH